MAATPTARSLALLRKQGMLVAVVERWNAHAGIRQDLFGIIDIVALADGRTLGVQTTSKSNMRARALKIAESEAYPHLLRAGWDVVIHGWHKDKSGRWHCDELAL